MSRHWSEDYVGLPYVEGTLDCAELLARVQREVFGRAVTVPRVRADGPFGRSGQIARGAENLADRIDGAEEGAAVLMKVRGLWHVGVWFYRGEPYVLHALRNAGQVVASRVRDLPGLGIRVEGFYRMRADG